jgi:large subunit ribosomal protein L4
MPSIKIYNMKGQETGTMDLSSIFEIDYNEPLIHQAVVTRLANERQGTKSTLTRSEVRGGGKKPWRQKGTGNARQGSTRAPQWTKGGVVFAPKSRDFSKKMNKRARRTALFSALSKKLVDGELYVVDKFETTGKTKEMVSFVEAMKFDKSVLLVLGQANELVVRSASNLQKVDTIPANQLSTYEVVKSKVVVLDVDTVKTYEEVYGE